MPFDKSLALKLERWMETVAITAIVLFGGYWFNRSDPFFLKAQFPWIWFGPLLIALRYGIAPGLVSVGGICLTFVVMLRTGLVAGTFPAAFMLGGLLMTLISGQFSAIWSHRLRRADQLSSHTGERFEQLSRAYFMVRLSHDRLEQNLISRPVTLRDAMLDLRNLLAKRSGQMDQETGAALMAILIHYCGLESAALYLADRDGRLQETPIAQCGKGAPLSADDLLLRSAIESGNTAYQAVNRLGEAEVSSYLVAAPLSTGSGTLLGVLLVTEMPFLSLHRETMQILGVLLAYAADNAESSRSADGVLATLPDCPPNFAAELVKMVRLRRDLEVRSALVLVNIKPHPRLEELCSALERQQRGLDHTWRRDLDRGVQFLTLMPFAGLASVEGYQVRIDSMLQRQFGRQLGEEGIRLRSTLLLAEEPLQQLLELLREEP